MISYVKPSRLHVRVWLLLPYLVLAPVAAYAQSEIPFNTPKNSIEYRAAGNSYTWQPVTGETPRPAQPYRPDFSGGSVSTAEPKAKWSPALPYEHKGGAAAKMSFSAVASKAAVASATAKELAKGAIACGAKPGHPLVVSAQIAGCMGGSLLLGAAIDWGITQFSANESGEVSAETFDSDYGRADGTLYRYKSLSSPTIYGTGYTFQTACMNAGVARAAELGHRITGYPMVTLARCEVNTRADGANSSITRSMVASHISDSSCPTGSYVRPDGSCHGSAMPKASKPVDQFVKAKVEDSPWGLAAAKAMAGVMMAGHNVFTDGTSGTITGPNTVPLGTSSESMPVNVIPGTTTVAPSGHTGATDSGTQTSTKTSTATNSYSGNQQTTTTGTTTSTTVTNNITNNSTTNVTNKTQSDDKPKEEEKDLCEKNPDALACAELDTPDGEIPETQIQLNYEYESLFGNGSCPTVDAVPFFGQNVQVVDMPKICQQTTDYIQPFVLVSAALIAMAIFAGGIRS